MLMIVIFKVDLYLTIVKGDSIFCATGITTSDILTGIKIKDNNYTSETFITHKNSNFKEIIKKTNLINE